MRGRTQKAAQTAGSRGFTLLELLVVMVIIGLLAGFVAIMIRVGIEEQLMSRHFPTTYEAYQRRTCKLVPFVW